MSDKWEQFKRDVLDAIDAESFCEAVLGGIKSRSGDEVTCLCNFHDDTRPSMCVNIKTKVFDCQACGKTGSLIDIWMQHKDLSFKEALLDLGQQNSIQAPQAKKGKPPIDAGKVAKWHEQLMNGCDAKRWLNEKRGLLDETLIQFKIGWDGKRNTIPIHDHRGNIVNVRRYNAKERAKMINYTDGKYKYGSPARLYGARDLVKRDCEEIFITEGEWDRILAEQHGFAAVTGTHGCKTFRDEWGRFFTGRKVRVVYDCDKEGRLAVEQKVLPVLLKNKPAEIKVIWLPLEGSPQCKDLSDYFLKEGFTAEDFRALVEAAEPEKLQEVDKRDTTLYPLESLAQIDHTDYIDRRVSCELVVCGHTNEPFHAPTKFRVTRCSEMDNGKCFECKEPIELDPADPAYIGVCMSTDDQVDRLLRRVCCDRGKRPKLEILDKTVVREFFANQRVERVISSDEENNQNQERVEKKVYLKGCSDEVIMTKGYKVKGWVRSHPKTQQICLLVDEIEPLEESFEKFEINDETRGHLKLFQEHSITQLLEFLSERVTRVYERDELLLGMLMTLCSIRRFDFQGERNVRGWVCMSVIGDSGTAKSQTILNLSNWTGVGDVFSGLTGSRTGLAYGLSEHKQKGWQIRVGRYPANTRRVLVLDEAQEVEPDDLSKIGKAMDEGWLQVDRIASEGYESETRLIALANPKRDRTIDQNSFGCESLKGVFIKMMIRRFDLCLFASSGDINDKSVYNRQVDLSAEPEMPLTPEALRSLIFFAWSRAPSQVNFSSGSVPLILARADHMSDKYGHCTDLPIVAPADFRKTLARLSVAYAVLDGSFTDDYQGVVIRPDHVAKVGQWMEERYSHPNCALDTYSDNARAANEFRLSEVEKYIEENIENAFRNIGDPTEREENKRKWVRMHRIVRDQQSVRNGELVDLLDVSKHWVSKRLSVWKKKQLIRSGPYGYQKTPKFVKFLRVISADERFSWAFNEEGNLES
jgi:DNA primase